MKRGRRLGLAVVVSLSLGTSLAADTSPDIAASPDVAVASAGSVTASPNTPTLTPLTSLSSAAAPVQLTVTGIAPAVAVPGRPVTLTVAVRNATSRTLRGVTLRVRRGTSSLTTREEIRRWADEGAHPGELPIVLNHPVPGSFAPASTAVVLVTLTGQRLPPNPYGTVPLVVEGTAGSSADSRRTYLPFFRIKEYTPLAMGFALPLTPDAEPSLYSTSDTERTRAWNAMLGPQGRIARLTAGTATAPVTWAIDPALLSPAPTSSARIGTTVPPTSTATGGATAPTTTTSAPPARGSTTTTPAADVTGLQSDLANRLRNERSRRSLWLLPRQDPDLSGLSRHGTGTRMLSELDAPEPAVTSALSGPVPRVAWGMDGWDSAQRTVVAASYGTEPPAAFLQPVSSLGGDQRVQPSAAQRDGERRLVLGWDEELSRLWGSLAGQVSAVEATQRFISDSAALLAQSPGRARSVLVAAPRFMDADPAVQSAFFDAVTSTPWLTTSDTVALTVPHATIPGSESGEEAASSPMSAGAPASRTPMTGDVGPAHPPDTLLNSSVITALEEQDLTLTGFSSAVPEPDADLAALRGATDTLAGTVWRYNPTGWTRLREGTGEAVNALTQGVSVRPSSVNFFADSGVLQLTVVNTLDWDVRNLTLTLNPEGRASRLRIISQPEPIHVRRNSRTTVRAVVEALAAGVVPVSTRLTTPAGTRLGGDATVRVTVQPTNGWTVLAVGGLAGVVFLAGMYRTLRGGKPRVTSEELNGIDLT